MVASRFSVGATKIAHPSRLQVIHLVTQRRVGGEDRWKTCCGDVTATTLTQAQQAGMRTVVCRACAAKAAGLLTYGGLASGAAQALLSQPETKRRRSSGMRPPPVVNGALSGR